MSRHGLHASIAEHLRVNNARGGYKLSLLCTEQGLLLAAAGQGMDAEVLELTRAAVQRLQAALESTPPWRVHELV